MTFAHDRNVTNNNLTGEIPATIQNNSQLHFQYINSSTLFLGLIYFGATKERSFN
jgi:hypothetical protein